MFRFLGSYVHWSGVRGRIGFGTSSENGATRWSRCCETSGGISASLFYSDRMFSFFSLPPFLVSIFVVIFMLQRGNIDELEQIDHFPHNPRYAPHTNGTFTQRYFFDDTYYKPGGPVYLYISGETAGENRFSNLQNGSEFPPLVDQFN